MWRWATALGRTPRELLATTTATEITEAMAFEQLEPFGALHAEQLAGAVCATLANLHLPRGGEPFKPADFMPALKRALNGYSKAPTDVQTPEQRAEGIRRLLGGKGAAKNRSQR